MAPPRVLGITGGIGSGKSAALRAFERHGAAVFSADEAVHALYRSDEVRSAVISRWGTPVCGPDGEIDRAAVARIVFEQPHELEWLEGLLHPLVAQRWLQFVEQQRSLPDPPTAIVAEVPLLFEAGLEDRYDATVLVTAPLALRLDRVGGRAGVADGADRAAVQMAEEEKARRADYVYVNDGSLDDLDAFVADLLADLER